MTEPKATVASWDGEVLVECTPTGGLHARLPDHGQELIVAKHYLPVIRDLVEGDQVAWALAEAIVERVKNDPSIGEG